MASAWQGYTVPAHGFADRISNDVHLFTTTAAASDFLAAQPTPATRPGVAAERAALLAALPTLGLACEAVWSAEVRYHTPHFEAMSLRTTLAEVSVPGTWRAGDLLQLRKVATVVHRAPAAGGDRSWREARFGPVRIKLRASNGEHDLAPLLPGDVLATVSRRDPIRSGSVTVWPSLDLAGLA
jgi:hypothetical protein